MACPRPSGGCGSRAARADWLGASVARRDACCTSRQLHADRERREERRKCHDSRRTTPESGEAAARPFAVGDWLQQPVVIAAWGDLEDAAQHLDAVPISMRLDEFVGRTDSPWNLVLGL